MVHCELRITKKHEVQGEGEKGLRDIDLSKKDLFMAIAKFATIKSTSKTKVQSVN